MSVKSFKLSDGTQIPWIGFGSGTAFFKMECKDAVALALSVGMTHIDTAGMYQNEESVGDAIASSGIQRSNLYVTTKLAAIPSGQTVEDCLRQSLKKLQLDYVDLYLIHAPVQHLERDGGLKQVWREMVEVKKKGLTWSIGVSNFNIKYLEDIIELGLEKPVVNQIEYHIFNCLRLEPLLAYSRKHDIITEAWGSLTPLLPDRIKDSEQLADACTKVKSILDEIARKRGDTVTQNQILFKWLEAKEIIAVTTSTKESRLMEYLETEQVKDLTPEEVEVIDNSAGIYHRFAVSLQFALPSVQKN
ncbi:Aldo/keto reductase [Fomitiporia mediterranea MF3/22]|uniref:Aldo/keto reductase n=1 Tax=Fomitiporia mediterranea (strain MF3/22) TaxID=694068 RepID=UPI000440941A|nr:Aldo/keto reductase [Fomitiporia mediterranea MF3/22]EJD08332.1 Aldo/keto reductase [Fomitiporia mediterranea MF3/22]